MHCLLRDLGNAVDQDGAHHLRRVALLAQHLRHGDRLDHRPHRLDLAPDEAAEGGDRTQRRRPQHNALEPIDKLRGALEWFATSPSWCSPWYFCAGPAHSTSCARSATACLY